MTEICLTVPRHRRRRLQVCCDARPAGISPPTTALLHDLTLPHVTHGCCQHNHDFKNSEYSAEARTTNYKCTIFCLFAHNLVCQQSINKPKHRLCSVTFSFVSCAINQYTSQKAVAFCDSTSLFRAMYCSFMNIFSSFEKSCSPTPHLYKTPQLYQTQSFTYEHITPQNIASHTED